MINRIQAFPKTEQQICAESVMCPKCRGGLHRMNDGEGRRSEVSGRMVL
jgi:transposase